MVNENFIKTTAIKKLLTFKKRIRGVPGGTSAGKTYGILPILIKFAQKYPRLEISVCSESFPHLRKGAMKDFKKILVAKKLWDPNKWSASNFTFTFPNSSYIEFFSVQDAGKVHGPRRDILYINECNRVSFETYHALAVRTKKIIYLDFNPVGAFWYHTEIVGAPDWEEIRLTFMDNESLNFQPAIIMELKKAKEKAKKSPYWANWWKVYGLGLLGSLEGTIFPNCKRINVLPVGETAYAIDWGYSADPTAIVKVVLRDEGLFRREIFYNRLYDPEKPENLDAVVQALIRSGCDDETPVIIDHDHIAREHLQKEGFNVFFAHKPAGSVLAGIQALQNVDIFTTWDSQNLISEEEKYMWDRDKKDSTKQANKPVDAYNHGWDSTRYAHDYLLDPKKKYYQDQKKNKKVARRFFAA